MNPSGEAGDGERSPADDGLAARNLRRRESQERFRKRLESEGGGAPIIGPGGKIDAAALRRAMGSGDGGEGREATRARPGDSGGGLAPDDAGGGEADAPAGAAEADDDAPNRVVFELQRDLEKRLDKYLTDRIPFMSRTQLQRLIDEGGVTVNGKRPKASTNLRLGDVVEVFVPPPPATETVAENIPLSVLYEDDSLIVLNKAADIIVHPARSHLSGTMINALAYHFRHRSSGALSGVGQEFARPGVVHRLDRHTSGVIVFAKDDTAHWRLGRQFERRMVDKRYLALVHGRVEPPGDVIELPIGPHPSRAKGYREKYVVRHDHLGKPSVTIYRVRAYFGTNRCPLTLLELELKTGRTHQIRVHLSHLGHPIVGDDMYGGEPVSIGDLEHAEAAAAMLAGVGVAAAPIARQALHAATLAFDHPTTGERMMFTAPVPADLGWVVAVVLASGGASGAGSVETGRDPGAGRPAVMVEAGGATVDLRALLPTACSAEPGR